MCTALFTRLKQLHVASPQPHACHTESDEEQKYLRGTNNTRRVFKTYRLKTSSSTHPCAGASSTRFYIWSPRHILQATKAFKAAIPKTRPNLRKLRSEPTAGGLVR